MGTAITGLFTFLVSKASLLAIGKEVATTAATAILSNPNIKQTVATFLKDALDKIRSGASTDEINSIMNIINELAEITGIGATCIHQQVNDKKVSTPLESALLSFVNGDTKPTSYINLTINSQVIQQATQPDTTQGNNTPTTPVK